jgi:hypothetical protein
MVNIGIGEHDGADRRRAQWRVRRRLQFGRLRDLLADVGGSVEENPANAIGRGGEARLRPLAYAGISGAGGTAQPEIAVPLGKTAAGRRSDDFQTHRHSPISNPILPQTRQRLVAAARYVTLEVKSTVRAPLSPAARADAAYFLGVISAGRYREISKPAATWHMVGFVQIFFIPFLLFHRPEWTDPVDIQPLLGTVLQRLVH